MMGRTSGCPAFPLRNVPMRNRLLAALLIWLSVAPALRAQSPWPAVPPYPTLRPDDDPAPCGPGPGDLDGTPCGHNAYGEVSFLLAWVKNRVSPPLLTSGPNLLLHDVSFDDQQRVGGRFNVGTWLDPGQTFGVEVGYFFLG